TSILSGNNHLLFKSVTTSGHQGRLAPAITPCVIAAGSLVRGEVAPFTVCAGNPLKVVGQRN
ncbi:hypothetical protein FHX09_005855, partial [Rhizobium sp. BK538]|nr:hypothetical protein [Rhizobium sp. BK538]